MIVTLCKIKKESFDNLQQDVLKIFSDTGSMVVSDEAVTLNSEPILIDGKTIDIEIDVEKYMSIAKEDSFGYTKFAKVGIALHQDIKSNEVVIPRNIFYEKEFWAYLSMTVFKDVVKELRLKEDGKITENKIKQFYFNSGEISRTGLLFLWVMVDRLESKNDYELTHTAFEFVDPVKAILERTMSKNPAILRAFVQGIINNGKDSKFKSDKFRSKVPSNISCYASVNMLDMLEYNELVDVVTKQQKMIISAK